MSRPAPAPVRPDPAVRRTRRRFARRQWARRFRVWRVLVLLVVVLALAGGAAWAVGWSSLLAVETVEVQGTSLLTPGQVEQAARVPVGEPLARVDLALLDSRVSSLAEVRSVEVSRSWPHTVVISVTERVPVAVAEVGGSLRGVDEDGQAFVTYRTAPAGLPRVTVPSGVTTESLAEAARVSAALPGDLRDRVDHLEVTSPDAIALVLRDGRRVEWGSSADSATKAEVAVVLLEQPAQVYDVSVPGQPTTSGTPAG